MGWGEISVSECYKYAYNTFRNADSHLMKNVEWGAVAYLTSAVGKIPYINNHNGNVVGMAGENQSESNHNFGYEWNTQKGVKASTTHNVYGVYGMSGGLEEFVSAFVNKKYYDEYLINDTSGKYAGILYANKDTKYVDVYDNPYSSGKIGDAVYETSNGCRWYSEDSYEAWDGDMAYESNMTGSLVFQRGGDNLNASGAGIFAFYIYSPAATDSSVGFRVVLAP